MKDTHATPIGTCAVACAIVCLMAIPGRTVLAQEADPASTARLRLGPVAVTPTIALRDVGVDTNVYNQSIADPVKDFAFTLVPEFTAVMGPRRANVTVQSATDVVYFARQQSERSVNENLSVAGRFALGRFSPFVEGGYLNTRQRITEEIDARARRVEKRGSVGLGVAVTPKVAAQVLADIWQMAFDADAVFDRHVLATELDRETDTVSANVRYTVTPLTTLVVAGERTRARFERAAIRNANMQEVRVGVNLHPRALVAGRAEIGYQRFRPVDPGVPRFSGLIGSAAVSYQLRGATTLGFLFDRTTDFSYLAGEPYYVREGFGLSVRRQLPRRWDVEVGAERTWHRYRRVIAALDDDPTGHSDRLLNGTIAIGHDLGPRTRVSVGLAYQDRVSDVSERRFSGFRVGTSIAYGF